MRQLFIKLTVIIMTYASQIAMPHTLNLYSAVRQLYLHKTGGKKPSVCAGDSGYAVLWLCAFCSASTHIPHSAKLPCHKAPRWAEGQPRRVEMWGGEDGGPALSAACPRGMVTHLEGSPSAASTHLPLTALHNDRSYLSIEISIMLGIGCY